MRAGKQGTLPPSWTYPWSSKALFNENDNTPLQELSAIFSHLKSLEPQQLNHELSAIITPTSQQCRLQHIINTLFTMIGFTTRAPCGDAIIKSRMMIQFLFDIKDCKLAIWDSKPNHDFPLGWIFLNLFKMMKGISNGTSDTPSPKALNERLQQFITHLINQLDDTSNHHVFSLAVKAGLDLKRLFPHEANQHQETIQRIEHLFLCLSIYIVPPQELTTLRLIRSEAADLPPIITTEIATIIKAFSECQLPWDHIGLTSLLEAYKVDKLSRLEANQTSKSTSGVSIFSTHCITSTTRTESQGSVHCTITIEAALLEIVASLIINHHGAIDPFRDERFYTPRP